MAKPVVVILAAGQGTRMRSKLPKLLHPICGREMIWWPIAAAREAGAKRVVVVDAPTRPLADYLDDGVEVAIQQVACGTGDAVKAAVEHFDTDDDVLVLYGDVPLIRPQTLAALAEAHAQSGAAATMLTAVLDDPTGYGRVVRGSDGSVERVVETKKPGDATEQELLINEVNTGIYVFSGALLRAALERIQNDNAQGEYYLPDVLPIIRQDGHTVAAHALGDAVEMFNVNDRLALSQATAVAQRRILEQHMLAGVTIIAPQATVIDAGVQIGTDVTILPGSSLHGATTIADGASIGPHTTLSDVSVGVGSKVIQTFADGAQIGANVTTGPFCYLRPGTVLHDNTKAGTFVELKNTEVGERSKVPHLSYIGDATIGEDTNLGAATVTANYDGYVKNRTSIGSRVHTSVDTTLVAPVTLGDDSYTGAGSVITDDVPDGALGIARARQSNLDGYAEKAKLRNAKPEKSA